MNGCFQELDTVNFNFDKVIGRFAGVLKDIKAKLFLYSIFYNIVLSPSQVLDVLVLRRGIFEDKSCLDSLYLPFSFSVDSDLITEKNKFSKQLARFLSRSGPDAFLFSSVSKGLTAAKNWGAYVEYNRNLSDNDLLSAASHDYKEIVEWAKILDEKQGSFGVSPYREALSFSDLFEEYSRYSSEFTFGKKGIIPKSRSGAYQIIEKEVPKGQQETSKEIPNFLSNLRYAMGTDSSLILDNQSRIITENSLDITDHLSCITLDLNGIFDKFPELRDIIYTTDMKRHSALLYEVRKFTDQGWERVGLNKLVEAKNFFSKALSTYIYALMKNREKNEKDLLGTVSPKISVNEVSVELVTLPVPFLKNLSLKHKLKGLGKFIGVNKLRNN